MQRETKAAQQAACTVHGTASPPIITAYAGLSWHAAFANRVQIYMAVAVRGRTILRLVPSRLDLACLVVDTSSVISLGHSCCMFSAVTAYCSGRHAQLWKLLCEVLCFQLVQVIS